MPRRSKSEDQQDQLAIELPKQKRKKYQTRAEISSAIKSARDIMRKDAGLNGDLDRLPQLSWLLFLRAFHERVDGLRTMEDLDYEPAIEERYRWDKWGADENFTGEGFLTFVNTELLPYLRGLEGKGEDDPRNYISAIFKEVNNRMLSGVLLRDLVNIVDRIDFQADESVHTMAFVYESIMKEMRDAAGDSGEFYTPRPVIKFMVEQSFLDLRESVMDPACGTGGFLVEALEEIRPQATTHVKLGQLRKNLQGIEKKPLPYLLCMMNLLLHGVDTPEVVRDNALVRMRNETGPRHRVDVVLTNPPFGAEEEDSVAERFPNGYSTKETAWLFLYSVIERLKPGGRCAIVMPINSMRDERQIAQRAKAKLLKECNLHTVVRLPQGVFSPYTPIPANLLFFEKTGPTAETWFYDLPLPEQSRGYTKTKPMRFEEFSSCRSWWGGQHRLNRQTSEQSWRMDAAKLRSANYNLYPPNPYATEKLRPAPPALLVSSIEKDIDDLQRGCTNLSSPTSVRPRMIKLADILTESSNFTTVSEENEYRIAGIYSYGRGLFEKPKIYGHETNYKRLNRLRDRQFVYSKLFGWEGALAVVTPEFDGLHVSHEFPTFTIDTETADVEYVAHLTKWPGLHEALKDLGTGLGARRQRVGVDRLLSTEIPLPELTEQRRITKQLDAALTSKRIADGAARKFASLHSSLLFEGMKPA